MSQSTHQSEGQYRANRVTSSQWSCQHTSQRVSIELRGSAVANMLTHQSEGQERANRVSGSQYIHQHIHQRVNKEQTGSAVANMSINTSVRGSINANRVSNSQSIKHQSEGQEWANRVSIELTGSVVANMSINTPVRGPIKSQQGQQ